MITLYIMLGIRDYVIRFVKGINKLSIKSVAIYI